MSKGAERSSSTAGRRLVTPAVVLVLVAFVGPVLFLVWQSISYPQVGIQNYAWLLTDNTSIEILWRTLYIAVASCLITLLLGYPYAYLISNSGPKTRAVLIFLVLVPFWTSMMVRTFAWVIILQGNGVLNTILNAVGIPDQNTLGTTTAVLIGMCHILMPFMVLPIVAVMQTIDKRLPLAAEVMGASPRKAFWTVYFPLSLPGVLAGGLMVFILSLGFYVTPAILGSPRQELISNALYNQVVQLLNWGHGGAQAVALLFMAASLLTIVALVGKVFGVKVGKLGGSGL